MSTHVSEQTGKETLVIKVGTNTLTDIEPVTDVPQLNPAAFSRIGQQILALHPRYNVIVVSSAAITAGMHETGISTRPDNETEMCELQRLASIGNSLLVNAWREALPGKVLGNLLLTQLSLERKDEERSRAIGVLLQHLTKNDIPIINENDAIAVGEIRYGDNDQLAATIAAQLHSEGLPTRLILLTDVDGLYRDYRDEQTLIREVYHLDDVRHLAIGTGSQHASGGMITKIKAADIATQAGVDMHIVNGALSDSIAGALAGTMGTHFYT